MTTETKCPNCGTPLPDLEMHQKGGGYGQGDAKYICNGGMAYVHKGRDFWNEETKTADYCQEEEAIYEDCTPTWEFAASIYIECIKNGESYEAKKNAEDEIIKLAKNYDALAKAYKHLKETGRTIIGE